MDNDILHTIFSLIVIILVVMFLVRIPIGLSEFDGGKYCSLVYGEDYFYSSASHTDLPFEVDTCSSVTEDGNITTKYISRNTIKAMCPSPGFLQLTKWKTKCREAHKSVEEDKGNI